MNLILIVDDHPANLSVLSESLAAGGFEVAVATNGESAIKQAQHNPPNLILLDVQMPGIDGFKTCERLKSDAATVDIPVIFMTALADTSDKVRGLKVGAVDYITKPFQQEEVLAKVDVHLQIQNLNQRLVEQNRILKDLTENLEQKIDERSRELQQTQLQLVQQEKLSSLGQLVAGVAHEINNPVSFIYGNLAPAQEYAENLLELLQLYQAEMPNPSQAIQAKQEEIGLEFAQQDFLRLLKSMQVGTERIRGIVLSLRIFSRLDEAEFKPVDLREGIDSTLMIVGHRLKANGKRPEIKVIVQSYGEIPLVICNAGQINQVVMNLVMNAIDALEEYDQTRSFEAIQQNPSTIHIDLKLGAPGWVAIHVRDNGPGIPEAVQKKIFDPFFTTKSVGKGTGLGLSISHQIVVEKHGGKLWCNSTPGQGTEFGLEIGIFCITPREGYDRNLM